MTRSNDHGDKHRTQITVMSTSARGGHCDSKGNGSGASDRVAAPASCGIDGGAARIRRLERRRARRPREITRFGELVIVLQSERGSLRRGFRRQRRKTESYGAEEERCGIGSLAGRSSEAPTSERGDGGRGPSARAGTTIGRRLRRSKEGTRESW